MNSLYLLLRVICTRHSDPQGEPSVRYPVIMEDDPIHEDPYPFCSGPTCPDKEPVNNQEAITRINDEVIAGLLTPKEATNIVQGKQVYQEGW